MHFSGCHSQGVSHTAMLLRDQITIYLRVQHTGNQCIHGSSAPKSSSLNITDGLAGMGSKKRPDIPQTQLGHYQCYIHQENITIEIGSIYVCIFKSFKKEQNNI